MRKMIAVISLVNMFASTCYSQDYQGIQIHVNGEIEFVLTDAQGRRSGLDPRTEDRYDEINQSYGVFSVDSEDPNVEPPEPTHVFMTQSPIDGLYTLRLFGTKLTSFTLIVTIAGSDLKDQDQLVQHGVIDSGFVREYQFEYHLSPQTPYEMERVYSEGNLQDDINSCYAIDLLGNRQFHLRLLRGADAFDSKIAKGDTIRARHELLALKKDLEEVHKTMSKEEKKAPRRRGRRIHRPTRDFVDDEAFEILTNDVDALLKQIPSLREKKRWKRIDEREGGKEQRGKIR
jgi:hypothetical protein